MTNHVKLNYSISGDNITAFCPKCYTTIPFKSIGCGIEVNVSEAMDGWQIRPAMLHAFAYDGAEDPRTMFMGTNCPTCHKPMVMIDSGIIPFVKSLNEMKLFTKFSCEGHFHEEIDPITDLIQHSVDTPYITFLDNGTVIKDVILYNLVKKLWFEIIPGSRDEYTIKPKIQHEANVLSVLFYNVWVNGIYMTRPATINLTEFNQLKANFMEALQYLCDNLPKWIRVWYDECEDDGKYFIDTQKKKEKYLNTWTSNMTLDDVVESLEEY